MSTTCTSMKAPHPDDYGKLNLYELDVDSPTVTSLKAQLHARFLGVMLRQLHELDLDYCRSNTTVSGALPYSADRNVTWYLMTASGVPKSLNCGQDTSCVKSISTQGGFAEFKKTELIPGTRYYICAWSNATTVRREFFDEHFDEIRLCGNGFLVDDSPPKPGQVTIVNQRNGYLTGSKEIVVSWHGFSDSRSDESTSNFNSGIKDFSLAVGMWTTRVLIVVKR